MQSPPPAYNHNSGPPTLLLSLLSLLLLLLLQKSHGGSLKLPLIHRNSKESPLRKRFESHLELLADVEKMDAARLKGFEHRLRSSIEAYYHHHHHRPVPNNSGYGDMKAARIRSKRMNSLRSNVVAGASVGSGQYLVSFKVGTPAQPVMLIADTGSDLVWVRCKLKSGGRRDKEAGLYKAYKSSTFSPIPCSARACRLVPHPPNSASCSRRHPNHGHACRYDYVYADLSDTRGVFAHETVTLNSSATHSARLRHLAFGCGLRNAGASFQGSSGVLGLGRGPISFTSQMGPVVGNRFSYCFASFFTKTTDTAGSSASSSYMILGDIQDSHQQPIRMASPSVWQFSPLVANPLAQTFYYVGVVSVSLNGADLRVPRSTWRIDAATGNGGVVIDSGTTLTYFLEPAYKRILAGFKKLVTYPRVQLPRIPLAPTFDLCVNVSSEALPPVFPQLTIHMAGNATMAPPTANYFIDVVEGVKCLGFQSVSSAYGFSVLGNLLQQNFLVQYDLNSDQLGFAPTICSTS